MVIERDLRLIGVKRTGRNGGEKRGVDTLQHGGLLSRQESTKMLKRGPLKPAAAAGLRVARRVARVRTHTLTSIRAGTDRSCAGCYEWKRRKITVGHVDLATQFGERARSPT